MKRATALEILTNNKLILARRFGVTHLAMFGSTARDVAQSNSDIDIPVAFDGPATFDGYVGLKDYLEDIFGAKVDLATEAMIKPRLRRRIEKDLLRVA
jgi:predicted nucleotidyltransferase